MLDYGETLFWLTWWRGALVPDHRRMRPVLVCLTAVLLATGLVACGDGGASPSTVSVASVTTATASESTARIALGMHFAMEPQPFRAGRTGRPSANARQVDMRLEGVTTLGEDLTADPSDLAGRLEVTGEETRSGALRDLGEQVFGRGFVLEAAGMQLPEGGGWVEIPVEQQKALHTLGAGVSDPTDLDALLASLEAADRLTEQEEREQVRGTVTTHLRAEISYEEMVEAQGLDLRERFTSDPQLAEVPDDVFEPALAAIRRMPVQLDVWVDDQTRLRRMKVVIDIAGMIRAVREAMDVSDPQPGTATMTISLELYDYGVPVDLEIPELEPELPGPPGLGAEEAG